VLHQEHLHLLSSAVEHHPAAQHQEHHSSAESVSSLLKIRCDKQQTDLNLITTILLAARPQLAGTRSAWLGRSTIALWVVGRIIHSKAYIKSVLPS
jgi:hypothetical protein